MDGSLTGSAPASTILSPGEEPTGPRARPPARVFISYERGADPDQSLAQFLYDSLAGQGHRVFKDVERIPTGADYAELISSEITGSDFFIVLLSKSSARQGWVAAETEMAKDSADHAGHPKILPVRLAYTQNLPLRLRAAIGHLNHFEWRDDTDSEKLLDIVVEAINAHQERAPPGATATEEPASPSNRLARGEHFIITESMWHSGGTRESLAGTMVVPVVSGQEQSLSVTRAAGPGFFRVKVLDSGALEVAIWSGANYRRVRSQPRRFITMLEGDSHTWCFARYLPDQPVLIKRPGSRNGPLVVTFAQDLVRAVWMITHQRVSVLESFLIVMKPPPAG